MFHELREHGRVAVDRSPLRVQDEVVAVRRVAVDSQNLLETGGGVAIVAFDVLFGFGERKLGFLGEPGRPNRERSGHPHPQRVAHTAEEKRRCPPREHRIVVCRKRVDHGSQVGQVLFAVVVEPLPEARAALLELRQPLFLNTVTLDRLEHQLAIGEAVAEALGDDAAKLRATASHFPRDDDQGHCVARLLSVLRTELATGART